MVGYRLMVTSRMSGPQDARRDLIVRSIRDDLKGHLHFQLADYERPEYLCPTQLRYFQLLFRDLQ